jgi:hypothetical protein
MDLVTVSIVTEPVVTISMDYVTVSRDLSCFTEKDQTDIFSFVFLRNLKDVHGKPYFTNYPDVYFSLYVLTTTANNPDIG